MSLAALLAAALACIQAGRSTWSARLVTPEGELAFELELALDGEHLGASLVDGMERIAVPRATRAGDELLLEFPDGDARIRASFTGNGASLHGTWERRLEDGTTAQLAFEATRRPARLPADLPPSSGPIHGKPDVLDGRWTVRFAGEEAVARARLEQDGARVTGTLVTATGDSLLLRGSAEVVSESRSDACANVSRVDFTLARFDGVHVLCLQDRSSSRAARSSAAISGRWIGRR